MKADLYNEDCLEGMKRIPDESIDAIICDLPYGTTKNPWDSVLPLEKLWEQYKRIIKKRGAIVLTCQMPFTAVLASSNLDMLKYEWIWVKSNATGFLNSSVAPLKIHENVLVFSKSAASFVKNPENAMIYSPQFRKGKAYETVRGSNSKNYDSKHQKATKTIQDGAHYMPVDVLEFASETDTVHPTQKPVDLMRYLIRTYTHVGDTVLDNCMGSGTTGVACMMEKRNFIGFELDEKYFKIAERRIGWEKAQLTLF